HTPEDNLENASRSSLQHHGEHAWSMLKAFNDHPPGQRVETPAVYFDWFGRWVFYWKAEYSVWISAAGILLVSILAWQNRLRDKNVFDTVKLGLKLMFVILVSLLGYASVFYALSIEDRFSPPWVTNPESISIAFWLTSTTTFVFLASRAVGEVSTDSLWVLTWFPWALIGLFVSCFVVGASYLFVVPVAFAICGRLLSRSFSSTRIVCDVLSSILVATLWMPIGILFYDAIGFSTPIVSGFRIAWLLVSLIPVAWSTERAMLQQLSWIGLVLTVISLISAVLFNPSN
ncbi:MAG: hypothetical protein AAGA30_19850, partial [Planctomycetota bacterium]